MEFCIMPVAARPVAVAVAGWPSAYDRVMHTAPRISHLY